MSIKFYRAFSAPVKVLSFDLDDTLYYNDEIIHQAERAQFDYICSELPEVKKQGIQPWIELKWLVLKSHPELKHDVTKWRKAVIRQGLLTATNDLSDPEINSIQNRAFRTFYDARSNFEIEPEVHETLTKLEKKFPLIAVTNGNVDIKRIGLSDYFVGYYRAGEKGNRMKPWPDMLNHAAKQLDVPEQHILHIGDNVRTDLIAADRAGCSSLWFNPTHQRLDSRTRLPNAEYSHLDDLLHLL